MESSSEIEISSGNRRPVDFSNVVSIKAISWASCVEAICRTEAHSEVAMKYQAK